MTRCLELLHMDLFGPSAVRSYGGNGYTLVIVDDYSRKNQNQLGCPIVSIRTDHGREFDNEVQFGEFCNANGITHNFLAPRTPQSNGVVERKNMTLQEMSRTVLNEQLLPQKFWCNAVDTSTYILNRILIKAILRKTPYKLLRGGTSTLDYFKVFGSKCYILNTKDYLTKFDPKSYEGVFLGYSQNSKAYIVLNKHTKKVKESLNVTFHENPPPSKTLPLVDDDLNEEEAIKELVPQPKNMTIIGTKWVFRNKLDENGIVSRNKARIRDSSLLFHPPTHLLLHSIRDSSLLFHPPDPEIQEEIDECISYIDALRDKGIDARVVIGTVDREESETGTKGPIEVRVERVTLPMMLEDAPEPDQEERAIECTYETLGSLVQIFHDHTEAIPVHHIQASEEVQMGQGYDSLQDSSSYSSSEASLDFHSDASSDSSSRHLLSDHSFLDLPSTSAGPFRKRRRSPITSVHALPPVSEALSPVHADLIPSPKRVIDSGYLADVEVDPRETSLRDDVM
nr:retrovirus-related Pol polyprotein from transposon TNT 1-94 [Tanacetum cinerariifolium]